MRGLRSFLRDDDGSELLEFALASTVLLMGIFGIMDCSRAVYSYHYCAQVARQASRFASVRGASWSGTSCTTSSYACMATSTDVTNYVKSVTPLGFAATNLTVTTTWPGTTAAGADCSATNVNNSPGCVVSVKVAYAFTFVLPYLPNPVLNLASTSKVTISQ